MSLLAGLSITMTTNCNDKSTNSSIKQKALSKGLKLLISSLSKLTRRNRKNVIKKIGRTIFFFAKKTRLRAIENITKALPELSIREVTDLAFDAYGNCAFGVAESFWLAEIEPEIFCDEATLRILQSGQGACIATMHLGCYEAVPLAVAKLSNHSVTLTNIPRFLDESMEFYSAVNITAINKKSAYAFGELLTSANSNTYISLHCDLYANQADVSFFGQKTKAPAGVVLLAKMSNKPLLLAYAIYQDDGQIQVFFETIHLNKQGSDSDLVAQTVDQLMAKIYQRFEQIIRQYPNQWYWSYNRWKN
jgi:KDO2-lipid IV(A) lauroyltransferase